MGKEPLVFTSNVTFFVGENGSGKSTLLEAMAVAYGLNPEGGTQNYVYRTHDSHSALHEGIDMRRDLLRPWNTFFLRAESFYNVASKAEDYSLLPGGEGMTYRNPATGRRSYLHEMSHGEAFLGFIQDSSKENGLYFLDEPEAALSPSRSSRCSMRCTSLPSTEASSSWRRTLRFCLGCRGRRSSPLTVTAARDLLRGDRGVSSDGALHQRREGLLRRLLG